jgi:tetratricopeptide (TPR) repeat protein
MSFTLPVYTGLSTQRRLTGARPLLQSWCIISIRMLIHALLRAAWRGYLRKPRWMGFHLAWILLAATSTSSLALADVIYLKNGHQIIAKVLSEGAKQVVYESGGGEISIPRSLVDHIEKGSVDSDAAPPAEAPNHAIPASDLPLPAQDAAQPAVAAHSEVITDSAIDPARLQHLDNEVLRSPNFENRNRLVRGYHTAAIFLARHGDPEAAIDLYRHALKFAPDDLALTLGLSYLLVKQTHYNGAIELLLPASIEYPKSADIPMLLGSAYYSSENLGRAIEEWKKALALQESQPLREALAKAEKEKDAASSYEEIQSIHFLLRYDGTEAKGLGKQILDTLESAFRDLQLDLDYYPRETIVVLVYSKDAFRDVTRSPTWVGALNDGKIRVPVSGLTGITPELNRLLKHELTHSFVHLITLDRCPVWFNEGLAQLEEGATTATLGTQLARELSSGRAPSYRALEASFMKLPEDQVAPAYAKSLAALEYLRETYGMAEIRQLLKAMASNPDFNALIEKDLRLNYASFETEVSSYVEKKYGS